MTPDKLREAVAGAIDVTDDTWQHGIGDSGIEWTLALADAALAVIREAVPEDETAESAVYPYDAEWERGHNSALRMMRRLLGGSA